MPITHRSLSVARFVRTALAPILAALALGQTGCASAAVRYAERGDFPALRAEIQKSHAVGKLGNGEARDIAKAVLTREIERLPANGEARIPELRACAKDVGSALESRAETRDPVALASLRLLVEEDVLSPGDTSRFEKDPDPAYRALAARRLTGSDDGDARKASLLAREALAREMAALAAGDGATLGELDALFEAARVDPDDEVRHLALRAAIDAVARKKKAVLEGLQGDADDDDKRAAAAGKLALDRLRDAWTSGGKGLRDDAASGFVASPFYELGGRDALRARLGEGPDRLLVASAILRMGEQRKDAEDLFLRQNAQGVAVSALRDGSTIERSFAVVLVRPEGDGLEALRGAARDADRDVALSALGKLLRVPSDEAKARVELVRAAGAKDDLVHAPRARGILAGARYMPIQLWLEEQAGRKEIGLKIRAAAGLAALGRVARAAPLLADDDPTVRSRTACLVLAVTR